MFVLPRAPSPLVVAVVVVVGRRFASRVSRQNQ